MNIKTRSWLIAFAVIALLVAAYGPSWRGYMKRMFEPAAYIDDARQQVGPFQKFSDPALFPNDYVSEYFQRSLPLLYRGFYMAAAAVIDVRLASKILTAVLHLAMVGLVGLAAWRMGGWAAVLPACSLVLSGAFYLARLTGGTPRAFAFPLVAAACVCILWRKPLWLAATAVVSAGFYPVVAFAQGLTLAILCLVPGRNAFCQWPFPRKAALIFGTAALCAVMLLPSALLRTTYGPVLTPADLGAYPEADEGGRFGDDSIGRSSPDVLATNLRTFATAPFIPHETRWIESVPPYPENPAVKWLVFAAAIGLVAQGILLREARGLLLMLAVASALYIAACRFPHLFFYADRHLKFLVPILSALGFAAGTALIANAMAARFRLPILGVLISLGITVGTALVSGGSIDTKEGLLKLNRVSGGMIDAVAALPPDALVAGWPKGLLDRVPYFAKRSVLVNKEGHYVFHRDYTLEMRRRVLATIDACFATDAAPFLELRQKWGVTHFIHDRELAASQPGLYKPFDTAIDAHLERIQRSGATLLIDKVQPPALYESGQWALYSIDAILSAAAQPGAGTTP